MAFFSWSRWFRSLTRPQAKPIRKRNAQLSLELLETRLAPSTDLWTGTAGNRWSLPGSWTTGVPKVGDDLVFPAGASQFSLQNDLAAGTMYNSLSIQGDNYRLAGNSIQLGSLNASGNSGFISVAANLFNTKITFNITMGGAGAGGGGQQVFSVGSNGLLEISGNLSGNTGVGMAKQGAGTLTLSGDNTAFTGAYTIAQGFLKVANSGAMGGASPGTTVQQNAQLQVSDTATGAPIAVKQALILNGGGPNALGAMYNTSGKNTWLGDIQLGSDTTFGAAAGTQVTITGSITNLGGGHNVTKEGTGTVGFAGADNYNGSTTVNNGILQISNNQALGIADGTLRTGTTVNQNEFATKFGTLQLTGGITVVNNLLTLNGQGFSGAPVGSIAPMGAVNNLSGANVWTGNVILGSLSPNNRDVVMRGESTTPNNTTSITDTLTFTGVIQDPNTPGTKLTKTGTGTIIFTNSNTYTGLTTIAGGVLEITDSQALGQNGKSGGVVVTEPIRSLPVAIPGGTLELSINNPFKMVDSVTGTTNTLRLTTPMTMQGFGALRGFGSPIGAPLGALYSASGINTWAGNIVIPDYLPFGGRFFGNQGAPESFSIGVDPDPSASADSGYFTNDYSLTVSGEIIGPNQGLPAAPPNPAVPPNPSAPGKASFSFGVPTTPLFLKVGAGQLILPNANDKFQGPTEIAAGWITIENSDSLGGVVASGGQNDQPTVTVDDGGALHLYDLSGNGVDVHQNLNLFGTGFTHPFSQISHQGALENVGGGNTVSGDIIIGVPTAAGAQAGIGVEKVLGPSQLTLRGTLTDVPKAIYIEKGLNTSLPAWLGDHGLFSPYEGGGPFDYTGYASHPTATSLTYDENIVETGSPTGSITITVNLPLPWDPALLDFGTSANRVDVYDGIYGLGGAAITNPTFPTGTPPPIFQNLIPNPAPANGHPITFTVAWSSNRVLDLYIGLGELLGPAFNGNFDPTKPPLHIGPASYSAVIQPSFMGPGGITKLGSQVLDLQGQGDFQGPVDIKQGVVLLQSSTGLGKGGGANSTTTVGNGTALVLANSVPYTNGGIQPNQGVLPGLQVINEHLVLEGLGTVLNGTPVAALTVWSDASNLVSGTVTPNDAVWRGPVTLKSSSAIQVGLNSRLIINGAIDDQTNASSAGSDLIKVGPGELMVAGAGSFRGNTYIGTNGVAGMPGFNPSGANTFFGGSASAAQGGGVVTVANGLGLGVPQGGVVVQQGSQIQLQGNIAVAGKSLTLAGDGDPTAPSAIPTWLSMGPSSITGEVEQGFTNNLTFDHATGRITGVAVDPIDENTIYVTAAGGGVWKTTNGGRTWVNVFDGVSNSWAGAIAIAPSSPNVIYLGTGESNNSVDFNNGSRTSYYGTGVYKSTDAGHTWTLLQDPSAAVSNPLLGKVVSKIVVNPNDPNMIWAAVADKPQLFIQGGPSDGTMALFAPPLASNDLNGTNGGVGIWRYDGNFSSWTNLTAIVSDARSGSGLPPGPDDNNLLVFPQTNANWSDLQVIQDPYTINPMTGLPQLTLIAALGSPGQGVNGFFGFYTNNPFLAGLLDPGGISELGGLDPASMNAVYVSLNADTATAVPGNKPIWNVGGYPNQSGNFGAAGPAVEVSQGRIAFSAFYNDQPGDATVNRANPGDGQITMYSVNVEPWQGINGFNSGGLINIMRSLDGGQTWKATKTQPPPNIFGADFLGGQGMYDVAIAAYPTAQLGIDNVYVAGVDGGTGDNFVLFSPDGGSTWRDVSVDSNGIAPHTDLHASALYVTPVVDANAGGQVNDLFLAGDGGIWEYHTGAGTWQNLNSNIGAVQFNGLAVSLSNPDIIFAGAQDNGTSRTDVANWNSVSQPWQWVDAGDGGQVAIDPTNPNNVYHVLNGFLFKSTTGGGPGSFSQLPNYPASFSLFFPLVIDPLSPNRLIAGGTTFDPQTGAQVGQLEETNDGGNSFVDMFSPNRAPIPQFDPNTGLLTQDGLLDVQQIAIAQFQGQFKADPGFPLVADKGTNTYDPDTIYVTGLDFGALNPSFQNPPSSGQGQVAYDLFVSKDHGNTWVRRTVPTTNAVGQIAVDPRNRDTLYLVTSSFTGAIDNSQPGKHVFQSLDAGQSWSDVTNNLPDVPVWSVVIDPRTEDVYIGTDQGVFSSTNGGATWSQFGAGMPQVEVTQMVIDPANNLLTVSTFGRGVWRAYLNGTTSSAGAISAVAGTSEWTGPVFLAGPTSVGAYGTVSLRDGAATAQLNIIGNIADATPGANYTLTKIGDGNVILSGVNSYGGITDIQKGAIIADNPSALGATGNGTVVQVGAALQLESSIVSEPLTLNGDGVFPFNDHNTGALESLANNNTYSGDITLNTANVTIGVDSGSTLTITGIISDGGNHDNLIKELIGTLVLDDLAGNNTYGGATLVYQGVLQVQSSGALFGSTATTVFDGAQLQLQTPTSGPNAGVPVVVTGETLDLSGSGIFGTGALLNIAGSNTWAGPIKLDAAPAFSAISYPVGVVSFGVANAADVLTIAGTISEVSQAAGTIASGLGKIGPGTLVLQQANAYAGTTYVNSGTVKIQNAGALGSANANEIQRVTVYDPTNPPTGTFQLVYNGQATVAIPSTASASEVATALNNLLTSLGVNGTVSVTRRVVPVTSSLLSEVLFSIMFQGGLAGVDIPLLLVLPAAGATATVSTVADGGAGTIVKNGAALVLDLDPNNTGTPQTVAGEQLHINGTGIGGAGAFDNLSGDNTWTGRVTLDASASYNGAAIGVDGGSLTVNADVAGASVATLSKVGPGTVFFPIANDYQGTTLIQNGVLDIANPGALGGPTTNEIQTVTIAGAATGSFKLTFKNQTTGNIAANATASQVQSALAALSSIGSVANVNVTLNNRVYTVTFVGTLAGQDQPQMTATASNGTQATVATVTDGGLGKTFVTNPGTLALRNNITVSSEQLILNGTGTNGIGALDSAAGSNTWHNPILLTGDTAFGAEAGAALTIDVAISQSAPSQVSKVGPGTMLLTGGAGTSDTYTGLTTVVAGTLQLNKTGGATAIPADLTVGLPGGLVPAVAQLLGPNQVPIGANVIVNSAQGLLDNNNQTTTLGNLTINDGAVETGNTGSITVGSLAMTGGQIQTGTAGHLNLAGNVTASSDAATGVAVIGGTGSVSLNGAARTFNVTAGGASSDLDVQVPINGPGTPGLVKSGNGRLELDAVNTYGVTTINAGDVEVDGKIGSVVLAGGGVSGTGSTATTGQVGDITGTGTGTANGTISPGDNGTSNPVGTLTTTPPSGSETWGKNTILSVDLIDASQPAGVGNDLLLVNGSLNLGGTQIAGGGPANNGGAQLVGTVGVNVNVGDSFTIVRTTGTISGIFQEPFANNIVFIGGYKFSVAYNSQSVVLTRQVNNSTLSLASSANPAVYGQTVDITATLTGEPGATAPFQPTDQIRFTLHTPGGDIVDIETVVNGKAHFDPNQNGALVPGTYTIDATFAGDPNYGPASVSGFSQIVTKSGTKTTIAASPTTPVYGEPLTIKATITPTGKGAGIATGIVTFFVDGGNANSGNGGFQQDVTFDASFGNVVPDTFTGLSVGTHTFTATYKGDGNFTGSSTGLPPLQVVVAKDNTTIQLVGAPASPAVLGQTVTFTATVSTNGPGTAVPTGTVGFFDGNASLGSGTLQFVNGSYQVSVQTSSLALGGHTITAKYSGSSLINANQTNISYTVTQIATTTTLTTSGSPAIYGQSVTFTATVGVAPPGSGIPTGNVTFSRGATTLGTVALDASGVAQFTTSSLPVGSYVITAKYNGTTSFAGSNATLTQDIQFTSVTTMTGAPNPATFGSNVTFTANVKPGPGMPAGVPAGSVDFVFDGGGFDSGARPLSGGQATFTINTLSLGGHTVVAVYSNSSNFYTDSSSAVFTENIIGASSTTLTRTQGSTPAVFGTQLIFQADVAATTPGAPTPTGTVTFFDGTASLGSQPLSGGSATLTISSLGVGNHTITATYNGDAATAKSTSSGVSQQITQVAATAQISSSLNPSNLGDSVIFTATVSAAGNVTPTGNVTFLVDGGNANAANGGFQFTTTLSNGQATYTVTGLTKGSHTVQAKYVDPAGNFSNANSPILTQKVLFATTVTNITASPNPAQINVPVQLTAQVGYTNGSGTVTGTVDFFDNTTNTDLGAGTVGANGQASISTTLTTFGAHNITATYSGDNNFNGSVGSISLPVVSGSTVNLTMTGGTNPSVYTAPLTYQVTVTPTAAGAPTPTGTVSIRDGSNILVTISLPAGQNTVSVNVTNLTQGTHNAITARYNGDSAVAASTSNALSQTVNVDPTNTNVTSSQNPATYGQPITFTATVGNTGAATGVPTGSVTFVVDGGPASGGFQQTVPLTNGQATYSPVNLPVSNVPHTVQAQYSGDPAGFAASSASLAGGQVVNAFNGQGFNYDAATKTLTVTGTNFSFAQSTQQDAGGTLHTTYYFTSDGVTEAFADTALTHATATGNGTAGFATLITNDTYLSNQGVTRETTETISLGSLNNPGVGSITKYDAGGNAVNFLTLSNFPLSYAYAGRADGSVSLYGSTAAAYNGFVTAGNYSYMGGPGEFHLVQGASSVYGYSSGQATDFAYHYSANAGSAYVMSGTAFSYMSTTDTVGGVTQSYFNVGVGFLQNTGVSRNPGLDYAYFIDSPGNDTFVGGTTYSFMYIPGPPSPFAEFDAAYGFALVFAQSFVGGTDIANVLDPNRNITTGFAVQTGSGRTA